MDQLYPIIRRVRRPLVPPDAIPPEIAVQVTKDGEPLPPVTEQPEPTDETEAD